MVVLGCFFGGAWLGLRLLLSGWFDNGDLLDRYLLYDVFNLCRVIRLNTCY